MVAADGADQEPLELSSQEETVGGIPARWLVKGNRAEKPGGHHSVTVPGILGYLFRDQTWIQLAIVAHRRGEFNTSK
jgi:hypothetical protein